MIKKGCGEKDTKPISKEKLHSHHILALEICLSEFERLTKLDVDLNSEYESLLADINGIYSRYIILNETKQNNQPRSPKSILNLLSNLYSSNSSENKSTKFNDLSNIRDLLTKPIDLVQTTFLVASLVFFLISFYIMLFFDFITNLNIQYSTIFNYVSLFFKYIAFQVFEIFKEFVYFCLFNFRNNFRNRNTKSSSSSLKYALDSAAD